MGTKKAPAKKPAPRKTRPAAYSVEEIPRSSGRDAVVMTEIVLPSHTNSHGTIFGGVIMSWVDVAGAIAATRFSRSPVVTVSVDYLHFIVPIKIGFTVQLVAQINYAGSTSMETEIVVYAENSITGEVRRATRAFLTYVAVDEFNRPRKVPKFVPETPEEKKRYREAEKRREQRLAWRKLY